MNSRPRSLNIKTIINALFCRPKSASISIFIFILPFIIHFLLISIFNRMTGEDSSVQYRDILELGQENYAKIISVKPQKGVLINNQNLQIITFEYFQNNQVLTAHTKVLLPDSLLAFKSDSFYKIKTYNGKSVIVGLEPVSLPKKVSYFIYFPPLLMGMPFFIYTTFHLRRRLKLYRYGIQQKGKILYVFINNGLPLSGFGRIICISYKYTIDGINFNTIDYSNDFYLIGKLKQGDEIPIFYLDKSPTVSCIIPIKDSLENNWGIDFNG